MEKQPKDPYLRQMHIQTALLAAILITILLLSLFAAVQFSSLRRTALSLETQIGNAVSSIKSAAEALSDVDVDGVNDAVSSLKEASQSLSKVDISSLNELVQSLGTVSSRLEKAVNSLTSFFGL